MIKTFGLQNFVLKFKLVYEVSFVGLARRQRGDRWKKIASQRHKHSPPSDSTEGLSIKSSSLRYCI